VCEPLPPNQKLRAELRGGRKDRAVEAVEDGAHDAAHGVLVHLRRGGLGAEGAVELVRLVLVLVEPQVVDAAHLVVGVARKHLAAVLHLQRVEGSVAALELGERAHAHADRHLVAVAAGRGRARLLAELG